MPATTIESALESHLLTKTEITDLIQTAGQPPRLHQGTLPKSSNVPAITWQKEEGGHLPELGAPLTAGDLMFPVFSFSAKAVLTADVTTLSDLIRRTFIELSTGGTVDGFRILSSEYIDTFDDKDELIRLSGSDKSVRSRTVLFSFGFRPNNAAVT